MASPNPISRFSNLELNTRFSEVAPGVESEETESFYMGEAARFWLEGLSEQALRSYAKVLEFNPKNNEAWAGQVKMLIELGEYREAKLWADKALERFPKNPDLLAAKAVALGRQGDHQGALAYSDACFEERGDGPYIWLARGDVFLARHEKRADYCFEKAVSLAPHDWLTHWMASRIYFHYSRFALALRSAQAALTSAPTTGKVWCQVGRCQMELGMLSLAEASYEHALELNPNCQEARIGLTGLRSAGWWDKLRGAWQRLFFR